MFFSRISLSDGLAWAKAKAARAAKHPKPRIPAASKIPIGSSIEPRPARLKAKVDAINAQLKKDADIARARFCKLFPKSLGCK